MNTEVMIKALQNPGAYPEQTSVVKLVQTHISWVFICDEFVYKLKKPVDFGFLDFTTLDKREYYCGLEITLNRRLSRGIYLEVARIGQKNGEVTLDGSGRTIEYAVKMKQISETLLMDRLLERGLVTTDMVEQVAVVLAVFYKAAETGEAQLVG